MFKTARVGEGGEKGGKKGERMKREEGGDRKNERGIIIII